MVYKHFPSYMEIKLWYTDIGTFEFKKKLRVKLYTGNSHWLMNEYYNLQWDINGLYYRLITFTSMEITFFPPNRSSNRKNFRLDKSPSKVKSFIIYNTPSPTIPFFLVGCLCVSNFHFFFTLPILSSLWNSLFSDLVGVPFYQL